MSRFCFVFNENAKIYAALITQKLKRKMPLKCCIGYSKDIHLLLQINKADTIMVALWNGNGNGKIFCPLIIRK